MGMFGSVFWGQRVGRVQAFSLDKMQELNALFIVELSISQGKGKNKKKKGREKRERKGKGRKGGDG